MMIEDKLAGLMRERADRPVDADALLAAALAAGRARKRRRHAAYAVVSAGVAGAVAATLLLDGGGAGGPAVVTSTGKGSADGLASWDSVPALPAVAGEPGAAKRPELVGADPTVLRFAVPWAPLPVQAVSWTSRDGVEQVDVQMVSGDEIVTGRVSMWRGPARGSADNASVPNATSEVEIDGHPAVVEQEQFDWGPNQWLTWHPATGLTMRVELVASGSKGGSGVRSGPEVVGIDDLKAFADAVRLDTTTACRVPFRISVAPADARLLTCSGSVSALESAAGSWDGWVVLSAGSRMVEVDYRALPGNDPGADPSATSIAPETTTPTPPGNEGSPGSQSPTPAGGSPVGGTPAGVSATEESGRVSSTGQTPLRTLSPEVGAWVVHGPGGEAEAGAILAGLVPAGDADDPATWPRRPLG
ncbi:hypothetical protein AB0J74_08725 [Asanoa sp. NPDC049573]|uniref:hypothetical protein n=1 Tax=Asanoa sp. NPDC049573 TaxID=3155396 RepID=UPI00343C33D3